ncbi:Molybdopterin oxidoreductase [Pseudomonas savastanoi pv. glycinea]|nr:Molybdopterin oxidoreductase [Pseudomonas savastanoi pv. glycinea]
MEIKTPGFCALCKSRCGSMMVTESGRFIRQEPNPQHPTGQALCIKGKAAPEIVYRDSRQLYPLRRTRPKGDPDPGWERITWDEALDITARALDAQRIAGGPERVAFGWTTPSGTPFSDDLRWVERFTNAFGSPNIAYGTEICNWHKDHAHAYTVGRSIASPDFENTGCVVLWGHNPSATWLDHATATGAAIARGAKLIVVDPRRAGFAGRADQWLRVRPGSDGALALGIANEMIRNGWFDDSFVRRWSNGPLLVRSDTGRFLRLGDIAGTCADDTQQHLCALDPSNRLIGYSVETKTFSTSDLPLLRGELDVLMADGRHVVCTTAFIAYEALCASYPPNRVEELCWVPAEQVTQTAKLLYESGPVCYYAWSGVGQHTNATQTDRAMAILMGLTGSFDAQGGNVSFGRPPANDVSAANLMTTEQRAKCIELSRSSLGPGRDRWIGADAMYKAILKGDPYPVRALVNFGRNFIVNHTNADQGAEALSSLEFFVHADVVLNPTAQYADIFLPINTPWERESLRVGFEGSAAAEKLIQLRQAAIAPIGESRSDGYVVFELAKRLGLGHLFWDGDIEAGLEYVLEPTGLTLDALRKQPQGFSFPAVTNYKQYEKNGFKTATGLMEIYSEVFLDAGEDPVPTFIEPALSPVGEEVLKFPLVLTSAKVVQYCHGQHRDIGSLRKRAPDPEVSLHPDTASERGVQEGDEVELRTPFGMAKMKAKYDSSLHPRVVCAQYGWWQANEALNKPGFDPRLEGGANLNRTLDDSVTDPISGSVGLRSSLCEIAPAKSIEGKAWVGWRDFTIEKMMRESSDVMSFYLKPTDGGPIPTFRGGQHLTVRWDGIEVGGPLVRCYSLSGKSQDQEQHLRISVKLARGEGGKGGRMSSALHGVFPQSRGQLQAPAGHFHLGSVADHSSILLVAGGIGITPTLSMLYELQRLEFAKPVKLLYGVRCGAEHAFKAEITVLQTAMPNLTVETYYSAPVDGDEAGGGSCFAGRISSEVVRRAYVAGAVVYLCGPGSMVQGLTTALVHSGADTRMIHTEAFGPSSLKVVGPEVKNPQLVKFAKSGGELTWKPGAGSLLDQLNGVGRSVSSGCRSGQCESCILPLISGKVVYPEGCVSVPDDQCLPCVCVFRSHRWF